MSKENSKNPKKESELEEALEESDKEKSKEESEEEIQGEEIIEQIQFNEFIMPITESRAPVLERVEIFQEPINLEQDISSAPSANQDTENSLDYSQASSQKQETQYYGPPVLRPINTSEDLPRQELLNPLESMRLHQNEINAGMINTEFKENKRRLPFEKQDRKYKEVKL